MTQYAAFPRGINAGYSMKMDELRGVFESLGYEDVRTVLASGNVLFETGRTAEATLTRRIEKALAAKFGAQIPVVIRTRAELVRLAESEPFAAKAGAKARPFVTFLKKKPARRELPQGKGFEILAIVDRTVCSVVAADGKTPDLMRVLDNEFGKEVTTRSWSTVERVLKAPS